MVPRCLHLGPQLPKELQGQGGASHSQALPGLAPPGSRRLARLLRLHHVPLHQRRQALVAQCAGVAHQAERLLRPARRQQAVKQGGTQRARA